MYELKRKAILNKVLARAPKMRKENTLIAYMTMQLFASRRRIFDAENRALLQRVFNKLYNAKVQEQKETVIRLNHFAKEEAMREAFSQKRIHSMLMRLYNNNVDCLRASYMKLKLWSEFNKPPDAGMYRKALGGIINRLERNWK